jgi:hypothetical protein
MVRKTYYGRLDSVLECPLSDKGFWGADLKGTTRLLAVITPCKTNGEDATQKVLSYDKTTTQIVVDLQSVECVIGRVCTRNRWGIIDRSGDFARTEFISSSSIQDPENGSNDSDSDSD